MEDMDFTGGCNAAAVAIKRHQDIHGAESLPSLVWTRLYYDSVAHQISPDPRQHYSKTFHPSKLLRDHCEFLRGFQETFNGILSIVTIGEGD